MKKLLFLLLFLPFAGFSQGRQFVIKINSDHQTTPFPTLVDTPIGYNTNSNKYPVLIFLHGAGEASITSVNDAGYLAGNYLSKIYNSASAGGPAYFIAHGLWPAYLEKQLIVVSPQAPGWSTASNQLKYLIENLIGAGYRIDTNRIYLTGLSAGGQGIVEYSARVGTQPKYLPAAIVPMSMAQGATQTGAAQIAKDQIYTWGFGQITTNADVHGVATGYECDYINAVSPGLATFTNYAGNAPHCCWNTYLDPNYKENGLSIYDWMLTKNRALIMLPIPVGTPKPKARITIDSTVISSPNSFVRVNADSSLRAASVQWLQLAGPSAAIWTPVTGAHKSDMLISGLFPGTYVFQQVVNDSLAQMDSVSVVVTVNPFLCPICPTCPPPVVCPPARKATGVSVQIVNGLPVVTYSYDDGKP